MDNPSTKEVKRQNSKCKETQLKKNTSPADINKADEEGRTPLHIACYLNDVDQVEYLLNNGANPNVRDSNLTTPLHWSAYRGNAKLVEKLIEAGADINTSDKNEIKPIKLAVLAKSIEVVKLILAKLPQECIYEDAPGPVAIAAHCGYDEILQALVDSTCFTVHNTDSNNIAPLSLAAASNHLSTVKLILVDLDASTYLEDNFGRSSIHWAAMNGNLEMMKLLLEKDEDLRHRTDSGGSTPLFLATAYGHYDLVSYLFEKDCLVDRKSGIWYNYFQLTTNITPDEFIINNFDKFKKSSSALYWAAAFCSLEIVRKFDLQVDFSGNGNTYLNNILSIASAFGKVDVVEYMLDMGADIDDESENGETALNWAAAHGFFDIVKLLVHKGANKKKSLCWASANGHIDIVKFLAEEGVDFEESDDDSEYRRNALLWAATCCHGDIIDYLLDVFPNLILTLDFLHWCVFNQLKAQVERVLALGIDPNIVDMYEFRPSLIWAAMSGNVEIAKLLITRGAGLNVADLDGDFAIHYAVEQNQIEMVKYLIELGVDVNLSGNIHTGIQYPLLKAVYAGNLEMVKLLLSYGADVNLATGRYNLALNMAVRFSRRDIEKVLLEKSPNKLDYFHTLAREGEKSDLERLIQEGADVNEINEDGETPLFNAIEKNEENTEYLISQGANIFHKNSQGQTPLHHAVQWSAEKIVKTFLQLKADVNAQCNHGNTPLILSIYQSSDKVFDMLLEYGADPNIVNIEGENALFASLHGETTKYLKELVKRGADIHAKDNQGHTLLVRSCENYDHSFIDYLLTTDIDIDAVGNDNVTAVSWAMQHNQDYVKKLVLNGADVSLDPKIISNCKEEYDLKHVKLLIGAGLKLSKVKSPFSEEGDENQVNQKIMDYIKYYEEHPMTLQELSRLICRKTFGKNYEILITNENVPKTLKSFLMYEDTD